MQEFGIEVHGSVDGLEITGVTLSTSDVRPGDLFVGVQGVKRHGASFAEQARDSGATAILTDRAGVAAARESGLPVLLVDDPRAALGEIAAWVYRTREQPPLLFATTGTNGKTSTAYLLEAVLRRLGLVTGLSTTSVRRIGEVEFPAGLTTPEASETHALLARMRESGARAAVIEVSAQALERQRVRGIRFDVAGFTNLSHDHLDDYPDIETYFEVKRRLFEPEYAARGVVSLDTEWGVRLAAEARIPIVTVATAGMASEAALAEADWRVEVGALTPTSTGFRLTARDGWSLESQVSVLGSHMAANAGLAIAMVVEAGFDRDQIAAALADGGIVSDLPGRMEPVSGERGPLLYVDYGHSPDAFTRILESVRPITPGKVVMVFGADGDRDVTKREEMGRIASELGDVVIVTDFHPRSEDPQTIRDALLAGARTAAHPAELHEIAEPSAAIAAAVAMSGEGDTILWAGPGHEDYRELADGVKIPESARELARDALREAGW